MTRKGKPQAHPRAAASADATARGETADTVPGEVIDRPDGFYWRSADGKREGGPFDTPELAQLDLETSEASDMAPTETLQEAESEIGVADWIDPETGEPAEGSSPPRLAEE